MPLEQLPPPQALDELLAHAENYANYAMRKVGRLPPTLFAATPNGLLTLMPESLADTGAKDDFANTARLMCLAHAATAAVLALESWATFAAPDEPLDTDTPPSEALDRREVIVLMGEAPGVQKQKLLAIIRTDAGGFFGLNDLEMPALDSIKGRFAQLLPTHPPSAKDRALAKAWLESRSGARGARRFPGSRLS
jgi:hypothetical protein